MVCRSAPSLLQELTRCQGHVYDVTDFLDEHPGGAEIILCVLHLWS